jgi:hypothetical protein
MQAPFQTLSEKQKQMEAMVNDINRRIEDLKVQFNLYFAGELRVPPEKERETLEKKIRNIMSAEQKSARLNLLIQNVSSRFSLYNNMWLKRLNEVETGVTAIQKKRVAYMVAEKEVKRKPKAKTVNVSLNSEESFDKFFDDYANLTAKKTSQPIDKEKVINSIKSKMITSNLIDAKVNLSVEKGKLKIKIKSSH